MSGLQMVELEAGTKIGFYEVLPIEVDPQGKPLRTCVGYGGFGSLYKVARGAKIYALKLAHSPVASYSADEKQWIEERGDREVATLKSLRHPNIVRVHAFDRWPDEDGRGFLVMDFVEGSTLDEWRAKTKPSLRRICEVFRAISLALHAAHRQDIFHRDLKCSNILVRIDGVPVIVDWGISRPASTYTITRARTMVGTYTCFAPEYCQWAFSQTNTRFETTPATELYVVGVMLFEMLTGRSPIAPESDDVATMRSIIVTKPSPPSSLNPAVPVELDELTLKLLEKVPTNRFLTGEALAARIEELLAVASASWDLPLEVSAVAMSSASTRVDRAQPVVLSKNSGPEAPAAGPAPDGPLAPLPKLSLASLQKPAFVIPESGRIALPPSESPTPPVPPALAAAADRLRGRSRRKVSPAVMVVGVVVAGVVAVIGLAAVGRQGEAKRPENLLARVQQEAMADAGTGAVVAREEPPSSLPPAPPGVAEPARSEESQRVGRRLARLATEPMPEGDADRAVHARFGRPTIRPDGTLEKVAVAVPPAPPPATDDDQPAWLKPLQSPPAQTAPASKDLGVPTGAHIRARLVTNLDSRTVGDGPVEAKLVRPFLVDGRAVFPSGTLFVGQAQTSGARFTIRFYRLRLPDRREVPFEGLAYDAIEKKQGLAASRKIEGAAKQGDAIASKVARGAADTLLTAASGGALPSDLAVGAGRQVLNQQGQAQSESSASVLLLDANVDFEVFVVHAF